MPRRRTPLHAGQYYHLYNRGVNRGRIFFEDANYLHFLRGVHRYLIPVLDVVAYCLMPTHYHLLVYVKNDDELLREGEKESSEVSKTSEVVIAAAPERVSEAIRRFTSSYTKAINKWYNRVGPIYQDAYHARHVAKEAYLLYLSRYIHLNPVTAGLVDEPADWRYSSYCDYVGLRDARLPHPNVILASFASRGAYRTFVKALPTREPDGWHKATFDERPHASPTAGAGGGRRRPGR